MVGSGCAMHADFGLAVFFEPGHLPRTDLGLEGTPWFLAPENLDSEFYPASDLWSAGVMAYQLLSGFMPFDDRRNRRSPMLSQVMHPITMDRVLPSTTPPAAWRGLLRGLPDTCTAPADMEVDPDRGARLQGQRLEGCLRGCEGLCATPAGQVRAPHALLLSVHAPDPALLKRTVTWNT